MAGMITTVEQLVASMGGTSAAAEAVGVDKRVVSNWKSRGRIPAEYFLRISATLGRDGERVDPSIFGFKPFEVRA